jgi:folate-binding protein YgfZ
VPNFTLSGHFLWQPASWLRVTGSDSLTFLQGQLTNDLKNLIQRGAVYGLWLNHKGRVQGDAFVLRAEDETFFIGSYASPAAAIQAHLESFLIADDVAITDETSDWAGVTWFTDATADEVRAALPEGFHFRGRRGGASHWEWVAPRAVVAEVVAGLDPALAISTETMEERRVAAGIPAVPRDIGPGELPQEGGLERDAISFSKGCYLGQEVMARLQAMGQVRRQLLPISGSGAPPAVPATLFAGERAVAKIRSVVATESGWQGLALVMLLHLPEDRRLAVSAGGEPAVTVEVPA